ncbi:MAG: SpoIIE family protein phosphatase [Oscillospiraceae bacterium]|nr:SpoIIE family protein phosphatase [Oscillospiraceae bacterium]
MKIGKKIFLSTFVLCLASLVFMIFVSFAKLFRVKKDLITNQSAQSESIYNTVLNSVGDYGEKFAIISNESYGKNVDSRLMEISNDVLTMKSFLEDLYKIYNPDQTGYKANNFLLNQGINFKDIEKEYNCVKIIEKYINNVLSNHNNTRVFYASQSGFLLSNSVVDYSSSSSIDRRERNWYKEAVEKKDISWTQVYTDLISKNPMVTCSAPVYWPDGKLAGVVEEDVEIITICKDILSQDSKMLKYSFLLDKDENFIIGSKENTSLDEIIEKDKKEKLLKTMKSSKESSGSFIEQGFIAGFSTVSSTNWKLGVILDSDEIIKPANLIKNCVAQVNKKNQEDISSQIKSQILLSLILGLIVSALALLVSKKVSNSITNPVKTLEDGVKVISKGNLNHSIKVNSKDEIGGLATSFNNMAVKLQDQIDKVVKVMTEKSKLSVELNVAKTIQKSMLPCVFPAFPNRNEIDIFASMDPAKEVGGDFYDFFFVDEDNMAFVIADVSGKGVPSALFMVIAKTLIKDHSQSGLPPSKVLEKINNRLYENNGAEMFLTCFMSILNIKTGVLTYSNAGHNFPLLCRKEKNFEWIKTKVKFVLAGFPDMKYKDEEMTLSQGDTLFFYTDGVTEALNEKQELYSNEKLISVLNSNDANKKTPKELLEFVSRSIKDFVGKAEQSDDITMLSFTIKNLKK